MAAPAPQAQPTRVCPHCATVAQTAGATCPWCRRSYRRRIWPALLAAALAQAAIVVLGCALLLNGFEDEIDTRLDGAVQEVRTDFNRDIADALDRVEAQIREELDRRLPATTP